MPKISIIVPIYNVEKFLPECIDSILSQSFKDFELILVNDGSPDNCDNICKKYMAMDPRIKYFEQTNQGVSSARNLGLLNASGDYVFVMDSDDTINPDFLKHALQTATQNNSDIVVMGAWFQKLMPQPPALSVMALFFRRKLLQQNPDIQFPIGLQPGEDGLFSHQLLALTNKISFDARPQYNYREHDNQNHKQINRATDKVLEQIPKWFDILTQFYTKHKLFETKALHLAKFLEHEPFEFRFTAMPFDNTQKEYLFRIVHDFYDINVKPYITVEQFLSLSRKFRMFLVSQDIHDFNERMERIDQATPKQKILLALNTNLIAGTGGVEHVLCNMANEMSQYGFDIQIATMEDKAGKPFFPLAAEIKFDNIFAPMNRMENLLFKLKRPFLHNTKRLTRSNLNHKSKRWQKFIKESQPDIAICFSLQTLQDMTYNQKQKCPVILTVHGNPLNDYTNRYWPRPKWENKMFQAAYNKANVIQVLLDSYKKGIPATYTGRVITIGNAVPCECIQSNWINKKSQKKIVCIARLSIEKHQDLLINAFAQISDKFPDWSLDIYGNGPKREEYETLLKSLNNNKIRLMGTTHDVMDVLKSADIFVLHSLIEGFPLVLAEAMGCGLPTIGLKCCDGTNEIIIHEKTGILIEDSVNEMKSALTKLMSNGELRNTYGKNAKIHMKKYSERKVWSAWFNEIRSLLSKGE